jgi:hypothetical protein
MNGHDERTLAAKFDALLPHLAERWRAPETDK